MSQKGLSTRSWFVDPERPVPRSWPFHRLTLRQLSGLLLRPVSTNRPASAGSEAAGEEGAPLVLMEQESSWMETPPVKIAGIVCSGRV